MNESTPIAPPSRTAGNSAAVPSYQDSQLDTIVRYQRRINGPKPLKLPPATRRKRGNRENSIDWRFAGWGSIKHLDSLLVESSVQREDGQKKRRKTSNSGMRLGVWLGTGIAGVAVAGSPFYSFPAVIAVAGVFSPICLLVATILLSCWRPIMNQLARSLPLSGANYIYLLNTTSAKYLVVFAATLTLLDDLATSVVSAGFAATFIVAQFNEATFPIPVSSLTILVIVGVGFLALFGCTNGARVTCAILIFHMTIMFSLFVAGVVEWGRAGNAVLVANWYAGQPVSSSEIGRRIFQGIRIGFLGATGFETAPDYISSLSPDPSIYPRLLRNLQYIAISVNAPLLLVVFAVLPSRTILLNPNSILNALASTSSRSLAILVSVDAVLVLSAGVMTGIISAIALVEQMIEGEILPKVLGRKLRGNGSLWVCLGGFVGVCVIIWASSGFDLGIVSQMLAITFLFVLLLYPISLLLLLINRPELSQQHNTRSSSLPLIGLTIALSLVLLIGNIVLAPLSLLYFLAYVGVLFVVVCVLANKGVLLIGLAWILAELAGGGEDDRGSRVGRELVRAEKCCLRAMEKLRGGDVIIFVKNDELINIYEEIKRIPSELEANAKILDEAFPAITVDLIFVQGSFTPALVRAISTKLEIPLALCFIMSAPDNLVQIVSSSVPPTASPKVVTTIASSSNQVVTPSEVEEIELRGKGEEIGEGGWSWREYGGLRIIG